MPSILQRSDYEDFLIHTCIGSGGDQLQACWRRAYRDFIEAEGLAVPLGPLSRFGPDPIRTGLVSSLNRPGGNVTGVVFTSTDLTAKRLGLLHELVPKAAVMAALLDPDAPVIETELRDPEAAGRAIGRQILFVKAADERDFAAGFGTIVQAGAGGLLLGSGAFFFSRRRQLATMAARHALPAIGATRNFAEAGSL